MISYAKGIESPKEVQPIKEHTLDSLLSALKTLGYNVTITLSS